MLWEEVLRAAGALALVLGLMGLAALAARRWGLAGPQTPADARLSITASLPLDARRRAVLLKRDGVEHLVILGPGGETIVEIGIQPHDRA
ncbi:MAG: FliO/MopB family protein [Alphaproteobacteria bacterium]|jgi:flagellar protein FliO/FliZ|nr:FliO/MopB family protein [Alphaproteobacteria bacterium]